MVEQRGDGAPAPPPRKRRVSILAQPKSYVGADSLRPNRNPNGILTQPNCVGCRVRVPISELKAYLAEKLAY